MRRSRTLLRCFALGWADDLPGLTDLFECHLLPVFQLNCDFRIALCGNGRADDGDRQGAQLLHFARDVLAANQRVQRDTD